MTAAFALEHLAEVGRRSRSSTSRRSPARPSRANEVTPRSAIPHGTIRPKSSRSVVTLSANPWLVIQREMRTPIAASLSLPDPDAGQARDSAGLDAEVGRRPDEHFLEIAHVAMHVASIGLQVEDRDSRRSARARDT